MVKVPERTAKLSPKFIGPRLVVDKLHGNKFQVLDPLLNTLETIHSDRLKETTIKPDLSLVDTYLEKATQRSSDQGRTNHNYNLRSRK